MGCGGMIAVCATFFVFVVGRSNDLLYRCFVRSISIVSSLFTIRSVLVLFFPLAVYFDIARLHSYYLPLTTILHTSSQGLESNVSGRVCWLCLCWDLVPGYGRDSFIRVKWSAIDERGRAGLTLRDIVSRPDHFQKKKGYRYGTARVEKKSCRYCCLIRHVAVSESIHSNSSILVSIAKPNPNQTQTPYA